MFSGPPLQDSPFSNKRINDLECCVGKFGLTSAFEVRNVFPAEQSLANSEQPIPRKGFWTLQKTENKNTDVHCMCDGQAWGDLPHTRH